jgi:hypothetical protein
VYRYAEEEFDFELGFEQEAGDAKKAALAKVAAADAINKRLQNAGILHGGGLYKLEFSCIKSEKQSADAIRDTRLPCQVYNP